MANSFAYEPQSTIHPKETILEYLSDRQWNQRELARRSGLSTKTVSELCSGKTSITAPTALALELVFDRPAHLWLNLQRQYEETNARVRQQENARDWNDWAQKFPLTAMKKYDFLEQDANRPSAETLLRFFGVASPANWEAVWESTQVAYRQTRMFETTDYAISAWVRAVEVAAEKITTRAFDAGTVKESLPELRRLTRIRGHKALERARELCARAGVAFVLVPALPKTGISGCTRWVSKDRAIVALTLRYKTDDQVWFTFFHELGHVLLHRKQHSLIVDNANEDLHDQVVDPMIQKVEDEANQFAADTLINPSALTEFIRTGHFDQPAIMAFAEAADIGPGILIGRLQREGVLAHYQGRTLKQEFHWERREEGPEDG